MRNGSPSNRTRSRTLRQTVLIDDRYRLITDQPEHLGGRRRALLGEPPARSPCTVWASSYARAKGWDLGEDVDIDYDHRRRLKTTIRLTGELSPSKLERLHRRRPAPSVARSRADSPSPRIELAPKAA